MPVQSYLSQQKPGPEQNPTSNSGSTQNSRGRPSHIPLTARGGSATNKTNMVMIDNIDEDTANIIITEIREKDFLDHIMQQIKEKKLETVALSKLEEKEESD